jgi:uncharacterized protein with PQ loop repeat
MKGETMNWVEILGWCLVATPFITVLPQVIQTIRSKDVNGLSLSSQLSWTASWIMWALYGLSIGSFPAFFNNVVGLLSDTVLLVFIIIYTLREHSWKQAIRREGSHIFVLFTILPVFIMYLAYGWGPAMLNLAIADFIALMPQLITTFKGESLSGLNVWSWWFKVVVNSAWITYGFGINNILSVGWAFFMIPVYFTVIIRIYYDRRRRKQAARVADELHEVELHGHN